MKNKILLVVFISISLISCKQKTFEENVIELELEYKHKDKNHVIYSVYTNISSKPVYIPRLGSSVSESLYYMKITDEEGKDMKEQVYYNDRYHYLTLNYGKRSDLYDSCNSNSYIVEYSELTEEPLGMNNKLLKRLVDKEYQQLLEVKDIDEYLLTPEDKKTIKNVLVFKYTNPLFLKPGEQYINCTYANMLTMSDKKLYIHIDYEPVIRKSKYYKVHITQLKDSLKIPLKMKDSVMGYHLYNRAFSSDTIAFN